MAERGRQPGFRMSEEHRVKIQNSNILSVLIEHTIGKREMSATQVTAGIALLKKVLPDLSAMEISGEVQMHDISADMPTAAEWEAEHTKPAGVTVN